MSFENPFRPGAGHAPPFLAGRNAEMAEFERLLSQSVILENAVLTGLRGLGKTVLLDSALRGAAIEKGWLWAGTDLSESASVGEDNLAVRILTDLSVLTSRIQIGESTRQQIGFANVPLSEPVYLDFNVLHEQYTKSPGLVADRLKFVLELAAKVVARSGKNGVIFAYDEAQVLSDQAGKDQYPLSVLLDVFQSIQKKGVPFMLVLTGLPTLFPKLVDARTFSERMFRVITLTKLDAGSSREAVCKPIADLDCPVKLSEDSIGKIVELSGGYPYFIQFICREVYDSFLQVEEPSPRTVPVREILRKLDTDFFAGRWNRITDRQRELLAVASQLPNAGDEFTVQDVVDMSEKLLSNPFGNSQVNQMFAKLAEAGLIYRNRHGKYCFAVPLLEDFVKRQNAEAPLFDWAENRP